MGVKAIWVIFVIVFPYLGVFVYLLARGGKMHEHAVEAAQAQDQAARAYIQNAVTTGSSDDRSARATREPEGAGRHRRRRVPEDEGQGRRQLSRAGARPAPKRT